MSTDAATMSGFSVKPLDETTAALVFRAVRELLMNVAKHAKSPKAVLSLSRDADQLQVEIEDSGVGLLLSDAACRAARCRTGRACSGSPVRTRPGTARLGKKSRRLRLPLVSKAKPVGKLNPPPLNPALVAQADRFGRGQGPGADAGQRVRHREPEIVVDAPG